MIPLTVVVACHNNAAWLEECLDSILAQTVDGLEIVVVDDASTDESLQVIRGYQTRFPARVRVIRLPRRRGVARARDRGFYEARGECVSTLDADDYLLCPDKLERELELVLAAARKGITTAAFSGVRRVDENKNPLPDDPLPLREGRITEDLMARSCRIPRDFTCLRELYFRAGGYDPRFPIYEDWDFKLRLSVLADFRYTGLDGVAYRRHAGGLSSAPIPLHLRWQQRVFRKNRHLVPAPARRRAKHALRVCWNDMRRRYLHQYVHKDGRFLQAWRYWIRLRVNGSPAPGWQQMLRRNPANPSSPGEKR